MSRPISRRRSNSGRAATAAWRRARKAPRLPDSAFCNEASASARAAFSLKAGEVSWGKAIGSGGGRAPRGVDEM
jgi:hypothetical protein